MKTAMQEHIEHLKIMQNMVKEKSLDPELTETINETLSGAIENAESFIEKEKQQIVEAFDDCFGSKREGEQYYKDIFK